MASTNRKLSLKGLCLLFATLSIIISACTADDFFLYELEDEAPEQPILKLLSKRQAITDQPGSKDLTTKEKDKKKLLATLGQGPENSSSDGLKATTNISADSNITEVTSTTVGPTLSLPDPPELDYDGQKVKIANITQDTHRYYNSTTDPNGGMKYWIDFDNENASTHDMLSASHRRAATVALSFDFPFYGHLVKNITIATGGFLYTGDYVHSWLAATQYIAPLMANFDTSMSNYSTIKYMDNGTAFAVQWDKVALQDKPDGGNFSFQAILLKTGDIIFAYKQIPLNVTSIADDTHPVKVGVSDAYIIDRTIFFVRRKTIYEYHKVDKKTDDVSSGSAIYFTALPTCVGFNSCDTCITNSIQFECVWCPTAERCSDGMDRHRQDWLIKGCDKFYIDANCSFPPPTPPTSAPSTESPFLPITNSPTKFPSSASTTTKPWDDFDNTASRVQNASSTSTTTMVPKSSKSSIPGARTNVNDDSGDEHKASNVSSVVGILLLIAMVVGIAGWLFYAYRNPHTPSGQCFIRYRPSQWRWRSGEAHYTAAAIHM